MRHLITTTWHQTQSFERKEKTGNHCYYANKWVFLSITLNPLWEIKCELNHFEFSLPCWFQFTLFAIHCCLKFSTTETMICIVLMETWICQHPCEILIQYICLVIIRHLFNATNFYVNPFILLNPCLHISADRVWFNNFFLWLKTCIQLEPFLQAYQSNFSGWQV